MISKIIPNWFNHLSIIFLLTTVSCASQPPTSIGLKDGKLAPCPNTPNCVSSEQTSTSSRVEPLTFNGIPEDAWQKLKSAVIDIGGKIEKEDTSYLWATFRSKIFGFVDDMEFRMDAKNRVIHMRSASRVGYSDMGVNKKRVEKLRSRFDQEKEQ